jgi:hypothetical protein
MSRETRKIHPAEPMIFALPNDDAVWIPQGSGNFLEWKVEYGTEQIKLLPDEETFEITSIGSGFYQIDVNITALANDAGSSAYMKLWLNGVAVAPSETRTYLFQGYPGILALSYILFLKNGDRINVEAATYSSDLIVPNYWGRFIMRWIPIEGWNNRKGGRNMNTFEEVR